MPELCTRVLTQWRQQTVEPHLSSNIIVSPTRIMIQIGMSSRRSRHCGILVPADHTFLGMARSDCEKVCRKRGVRCQAHDHIFRGNFGADHRVAFNVRNSCDRLTVLMLVFSAELINTRLYIVQRTTWRQGDSTQRSRRGGDEG
jgi:hypothetical protein